MSRSHIVDYENLMETSFNDSNTTTVRTHVRPRWEKKKHQALQMQQQSKKGVQVGPGKPVGGLSKGNKNDGVPLGVSNGGDRFIPNRAGMNMDLSKHLISRSSSFDSNNFDGPENDLPEDQKAVSDAAKDMYNSNLSSALLGVDDINNSRVMSYQEKAPTPAGDTVNNLDILYSGAAAATQKKKSNTKLVTRHISSAPSRILDAPDMMDDYYLNLISWSDTNVLAVALAQTVYLWNASTGDIQELCTFDSGPNSYVSSVQWVQQGGTHLAVGTSSGETQLWDVHACKQLRSMDGHTDRVGSLAWNRHVLSSGSRDCTVVNHDVRVSSHITTVQSNHTQEVCGLSWSPDGEMLASGGNDNLVCLWDASATSSRPQPCFRLTDHQAAVKGLAWSPHERNLLATGGGTADRTIKFWNSTTGACLNSIDTGSQVCGLLWNPHEKEILSSHGYARNQLCIWKYPSMAKVKELEGHTSRVLHMACSPDGGSVVSGAADETLRFWDVFAPPASKKSSSVSDFSSIATDGARGRTRWTAQIR